MNDFIAQCVGHGEGATIYDCPRRSGSDGFDVACIAADSFANNVCPALPAALAASTLSRGGTFVPRTN